MSRNRTQTGFTLMELLIVLTIIGLMVGLTTPFLMSTLDRIKGQSSVKELGTIFRWARSRAITEKVPYAFTANMANNQYWLTNIATQINDNIRSLDPSLKILRFRNGEYEILEGAFQIFFYPQGNTSGGILEVMSLKGGKNALTFSVTLDPITGRSYVQQQNG